jgi:hypothetical protein
VLENTNSINNKSYLINPNIGYKLSKAFSLYLYACFLWNPAFVTFLVMCP